MDDGQGRYDMIKQQFETIYGEMTDDKKLLHTINNWSPDLNTSSRQATMISNILPGEKNQNSPSLLNQEQMIF